MQKQDIALCNKLGLHARSAAKLVSISSAFTCQCSITYYQKTVSAKSIMELLMLAAKYQETLTVICDGEDEDEALTAIINLINSRFDEPE